MRRWNYLAESVSQDARYALRWFRRDLAVTGAIVLTLAFGIGLNTGVFSVLSGMIFRSRVERDPGSFFQVLAGSAGQPDAAPRLFASSIADLKVFRSAPGVAMAAAWAVSSGRLEQDAEATLLQLVSCDFFSVYGLDRPKLGRLFTSRECEQPSAVPVVLLSEGLWRDRFHEDPQILDRSILIRNTMFRVVGILPSGFAGRLRGPGVWIPLSMQATFFAGADLNHLDTRPWLTVEGRLHSGNTRTDLEHEFNKLASARGGAPVVLTDGSLFQDPSTRLLAGSVSVLTWGALGFILLLACTNVTMLLLVRAVSRRYEMSVRLALGASRGRLLRMAATEGILLASLSTGLSAALAAAVPTTLQRLIPQMPHYPMHTDGIVFTYMAGITVLAGCAAALVPAAESLRLNLNGSLKNQESAVGSGSRRLRFRELLVAGQVAASLILVVAASLFARTQYRLFIADPGFNSGSLVVVSLAQRGAAASNSEIAAKLRAVEGVRSVAFASSFFGSRRDTSTVGLDGGRTAQVSVTTVSESFFETLGLSVTQGASPSLRESQQVMVSQAGAQRLWPAGNALHQTLKTSDGQTWVIAGIVPESELDRRSSVPRVYRVMDANAGATVLIRCDGGVNAILPVINSTLHTTGAEMRDLPRTVQSEINEMGSRFRVTSGFALFLGASAFALAVIGVYGVMAFSVSRRMKEMGIRLALGATRWDIVREVVGSGMKPVILGFAAGLPIAVAFAFALEWAFRSTPTPFQARDPFSFAPVPLLLALGSILAMLRPALKACAANPASSLREE